MGDVEKARDGDREKRKAVFVKNSERDKRGILWVLQSKVAKGFECGFAVEIFNTARRAADENKARKAAELDEFRALKVEASNEALKSRALLGARAAEPKAKQARLEKAKEPTG